MSPSYNPFDNSEETLKTAKSIDHDKSGREQRRARRKQTRVRYKRK